MSHVIRSSEISVYESEMQRRSFISLVGGAVSGPLVGRAQQKAMPVIGFLNTGSAGPLAPNVAGFRQGLSETGYTEGKNLVIEYRWADDHDEKLPAFAADLVARKVDVIAASSGAARAAKGATSTIPIVFMGVGDPVGSGLVASLARPGGNATGFSNIFLDLMPKRLELLSELVPQARVIALLVNPKAPSVEAQIKIVQEAAHAKRVQLPIVKAGSESEIDTAFASLVERHVGALFVAGDPFFYTKQDSHGLSTYGRIPGGSYRMWGGACRGSRG